MQIPQQQQSQIHTKVAQVSGQKDIPIVTGGTRSATRIANNSASIPALRNILPKNAVVCVTNFVSFSLNNKNAIHSGGGYNFLR